MMSVFANGRAVACKAGMGKSIAAFPDVCLSPPTPPAGPVPLPYPLTAMASDTSSGSKKVKVNKKELMLKSDSSFKKCMGDEAATKTLGMGVITHNITGKVYFCMWSMDVKVEGANAVRHLDLVTHNHMSQIGQTPPWTFAERAALAKGLDECKTEVNRAKKKCQPWKKKAKCPPTASIKGAETKRATAKAAWKATAPRSAARRAAKAAYDRSKANVDRAYERHAQRIASDPCQKALRCLLVPYGEGLCCPKQTGHHVVEASSFFTTGRGPSGALSGCGDYKTADAPCVCAEGPNQNTATHGHLHTFSGNANLKSLKKARRRKYIKYRAAKNNGAKAVGKSFPGSACSEKCIKAQLDKYHKNANIKEDTDVKAVATGKTSDAAVQNATTQVQTWKT